MKIEDVVKNGVEFVMDMPIDTEIEYSVMLENQNEATVKAERTGNTITITIIAEGHDPITSEFEADGITHLPPHILN